MIVEIFSEIFRKKKKEYKLEPIDQKMNLKLRLPRATDPTIYLRNQITRCQITLARWHH